jgi:hypothetical protein
MARSKRIYVVEAKKNDDVHYWAAATTPENATRAVLQQLGEGWDVQLTRYVVDQPYAEAIDLPAGRVCRIKYPAAIRFDV